MRDALLLLAALVVAIYVCLYALRAFVDFLARIELRWYRWPIDGDTSTAWEDDER